MVNTLAVVWWVMGGVQLLAAALLGFTFGAFGMIPILAEGDEDALIAGGVFMLFAVFFSFFMAIMTIPTFATAWGLQKRKSWARILAMVLGGLQLLSFPLGTALGVYTLVVLTKPEVAKEFA